MPAALPKDSVKASANAMQQMESAPDKVAEMGSGRNRRAGQIQRG